MSWLCWLSLAVSVFAVASLIAAVALDAGTQGGRWWGLDRPRLIDVLFSCFLGGAVGNVFLVLVIGLLVMVGVA